MKPFATTLEAAQAAVRQLTDPTFTIDPERPYIDSMLLIEALILEAEMKMGEARGAVFHHGRMLREYGEDHPVTQQAYRFAMDLNGQATEMNRIARQLHNAQKAFLDKNFTFH